MLTTRLNAIILNWNGRDDTIECIRSAIAAGLDESQIILVDNGSTDESVATVKAAYPGVDIVQIERNLGFAAGMNVGIRASVQKGSAYHLLLNNDTVLAPHMVDNLIEQATMQPEVGICVPRISLASDPRILWSAGAEWTAFPPRVRMIGYLKADGPVHDNMRYLKQATGCCLLVKDVVFSKVGLLDEDYFMYFEDYDFCQRVTAAGYRILYVPRAELRHKVSRSLGEGSAAKWYWLGRSSARFYRLAVKKPLWAYLLYVGWVIGREASRRNLSALRPFLSGVAKGLVSKPLTRTVLNPGAPNA
jgi:GT2 family glycosyltransferase